MLDAIPSFPGCSVGVVNPFCRANPIESLHFSYF